MHVQDKGHRSNSAFVPWDNYTEVSACSFSGRFLWHAWLEPRSAYKNTDLQEDSDKDGWGDVQEVRHPEWWPDGYQQYIDAEHHACYDPAKVRPEHAFAICAHISDLSAVVQGCPSKKHARHFTDRGMLLCNRCNILSV